MVEESQRSRVAACTGTKGNGAAVEDPGLEVVEESHRDRVAPLTTLASKLDALPVGEEFQFAKADKMATAPINWPTRFDAEVASCVVHGSIPPEIDGTFYRVICDSIYTNRNGKDIWINGDGAIDAWRISNGVCDFKQKFVRTPRFIIERAARKSIFGTYRNPFAGDKRVFDMVQSPGNTHIHYWQGLLLAAKEDSPPIVMDPDTLDTIGINKSL